MAPRSLRGATSRSPLGVWRPRPIQVCFPSGSHAGPLPGNSRFLLQISNACYRVCFIGGDMLVFFLSKFLKLAPSSTRLLQLSSRISRIGVNKRVFSPLLALVSLLRQGVVTCAAYFPFCFDTAVKGFSLYWNRYCDRLFDRAVSIWLIYYRLCSFKNSRYHLWYH